MKVKINLVLLVLASVLMVACGGQQQSDETTSKTDAIEVSVDSLLNDASALEGKIVVFTAIVDHSCMHGGKRLTVYGSEEGRTMKIDGTETSPKFVSSLMGKKVEVTGKVLKVPGTHVEDCEKEEGKVVPEVAYVVECIDYKELQ
jgi:hypothetical protein